MRSEVIAVQDAVGRILSHDITRIAKGEFKGPQLRRGHVISEADIEPMLVAGKEHVYVLDLDDGDVHEDEAGLRLGKSAAGEGVYISGPVESRVNMMAAYHGLLKVDTGTLQEVNALPEVVMATLPSNTEVHQGEIIAGTKVIPLVIKEEILAKAESIMARNPVVAVKPFLKKRAGIVVTGTEVYYGRIEDAFESVLKKKLRSLGSELLFVDFAPDDSQMVTDLIKKQLLLGAELVMVTGGMSVDPDDVSPHAIRSTGAQVVQYGAPVLPGAMFMMAYFGEVPIIGVPACGMFFRITVLDLILPRVLAGEKINRQDIISLGHGGLCRSRKPCHFPGCSFGTGGDR